ncbi:hypothetical protein ASG90_10805 [Nocardioides sp. Soil797]|nr:hypothetical protein ASG90_10805 [Nocardioides sp. Soil797]
MLTRLPRTVIAALLAPSLLLAGCNGADDSSAKGDTTTSSGAADGELVQLSAGSFYETVMTAQKSAGTFRGTGTTTSGAATSQADVEGEYTDSGLSIRSTTPAGEGLPMTVVVIDDVMYLQGSDFNIPDGKWLKFDSHAPGNADSMLTQIMTTSDPSRFFAAMRDPKKFSLVGEESVDGVAANHYQLTIDSATYAEKLALPGEVASMLPPELTFDMWVDAENRPVKVLQVYEAQGQPITVEQTYTDYGADVDIEAPDDADVVTR